MNLMNKSITRLTCSLLILLFYSAHSYSDSAFVLDSNDKRTLYFDFNGKKSELKIADLINLVPVEKITVHDIDFEAERAYWAVDFRALLVALGYGEAELRKFGEASFICDDGYTVNSHVNTVLTSSAKPYLALASAEKFSMDQLIDGRWEPYQQGRNTIGFDPFYLVWYSEAVDSHEPLKALPWPYQLAKISFSLDSAYAAIAPEADGKNELASLESGFEIFTESCIRCHQLYDIGGTLGPSLLRENGMLGVLDDATLAQLITNAKSFFPKTAMPDFSSTLTKSDAEDVVRYLRYIKMSGVKTRGIKE